MNALKYIIFMIIFLVTQSLATTYYDRTNGIQEMVEKWKIYDKDPSGAKVELDDFDDEHTKAIRFVGTDIKNGYMIGNIEGRKGAWNNTAEYILKLTMKFDDNYLFYVRVMTKKGARYIMYVPNDESKGKINNTYIHIGLGTENTNDAWQNIERNLKDDLKKYEPDNELVSVNAFLLRGNGLIRHLSLLSQTVWTYTFDNKFFTLRLVDDEIRTSTLYMKQFDYYGISIGDEIVIWEEKSAYSSFDKMTLYNVYVLSLGKGDYGVIYTLYSQASDEFIDLVRYDHNGNEESGNSISTINPGGSNPTISLLKNGNYVIALNTNAMGGFGSFRVLIYNNNGSLIKDQSIDSEDYSTEVLNPKIRVLENGKFMVISEQSETWIFDVNGDLISK